MGFETIINQPLAVTLVQRWLAKETTQPLLMCGPEGSGKRAMALETAKALNCQETPGVAGCGRCLSCKKIAAGRHPDVRVLDMEHQAAARGEPLEKQQTLGINTVLEERKRLYQTANEGRWKVSIIDEAHRLTPDAANVLLKVTEEPPQRTAIFLLTPFRDRLFATLVSRCQPVRFRPRTEKYETNPEIESLWSQLPKMTPAQILSRPESRAKTTAAANRVDMEAQLKALLSPALRDLRSGRPNAAQKVDLIQKAQQQLRQNVPPSLVYDHLLIQLAASKHS